MGYTLQDILNMDVRNVQKKFPTIQPIEENVYQSLLGFMLPEYTLNWVENIFVPGSPYSENINTIYSCARKASEKLGKEDDYDRDIQNLMDAYDDNEKIIAYEMFKYGMKYQKMLDAKKEE